MNAFNKLPPASYMNAEKNQIHSMRNKLFGTQSWLSLVSIFPRLSRERRALSPLPFTHSTPPLPQPAKLFQVHVGASQKYDRFIISTLLKAFWPACSKQNVISELGNMLTCYRATSLRLLRDVTDIPSHWFSFTAYFTSTNVFSILTFTGAWETLLHLAALRLCSFMRSSLKGAE